MTSIRDRINALTVQAVSSDGRIRGTLTGQVTFDLAFRDDSFYMYSRTNLEHQLSLVITELYQGAYEGRRQILVEAGFTLYDPEKPHWNKRTRETNAKRDSIEYEGQSHSEAITIRSPGWKQFNVTIDDQPLCRMKACDFVTEVKEAMAELTVDYRVAERMIKREVYGFNNGY